MLVEYNIEHFTSGSAKALLVVRQSIRNRDVRDFLCLEGPCVKFKGFYDMTGGSDSFTVETRHKIKNSTERSSGRGFTADSVLRFLCDGMDFRELCRIFGERYAAVSAFDVRMEYSFRANTEKNIRAGYHDHVFSYAKVEITCERVFDEDLTCFFELVRYRGGDNFDLYWDGFPDIDLNFTDGRAKGCNVFMRSLSIYDIQSDDIPNGVHFRAILPVIIAFSRIAACQFDYIVPAEELIRFGVAKTDVRRIWSAPDGEVHYSPAGEGVRTWLSFLAQKEQTAAATLLESVISSPPGMTLILSETGLDEGERMFLEMQKTVYKDWIRIYDNCHDF